MSRTSHLVLPEHLAESLRWYAGLLDSYLPRSAYAMGGGSVLAARWHHRLSTDIDLFIDASTYAELEESNALDDLSGRLVFLSEQDQIHNLALYPNGHLFVGPFGPVSLFSTLRRTACPTSVESEPSTGVLMEATPEILFRKIRGRMIQDISYVARDLYDVVVAQLIDETALSAAFDELTALERRSLVYDVEQGRIDVGDLDRIIDPRFTRLTTDFSLFRQLASDILSQRIGEDSHGIIQELRDQNRSGL